MSAQAILGSYAAKDCPLKVQYDETDAKVGVDQLPQSAFSEMLTSGGIAFEAEVFTTIVTGVQGVVDLSSTGDKITALAEATVAAMDAGAPVILGGALPLDQAARRTGKPDVLVRAEPRDGIWRYLPVDVKHHSARKVPSKPDDKSVAQSSLDAPALRPREDNRERLQGQRGRSYIPDAGSSAGHSRTRTNATTTAPRNLLDAPQQPRKLPLDPERIRSVTATGYGIGTGHEHPWRDRRVRVGILQRWSDWPGRLRGGHPYRTSSPMASSILVMVWMSGQVSPRTSLLRVEWARSAVAARSVMVRVSSAATTLRAILAVSVT